MAPRGGGPVGVLQGGMPGQVFLPISQGEEGREAGGWDCGFQGAIAMATVQAALILWAQQSCQKSEGVGGLLALGPEPARDLGWVWHV